MNGSDLFGSGDVELWSRYVWVECESGPFSEVDGGVWGLWVVMVVLEAVLEI